MYSGASLECGAQGARQASNRGGTAFFTPMTKAGVLRARFGAQRYLLASSGISGS